jgi:16S rRNA (adenine1518-N6/adenine1519-N6)-dimethyltransferase
VIAIELDRALAEMLRTRYASDPKVTIVEGDVLDVNIDAIIQSEGEGDRYALVGNVPYYITTPILFQSLEPPRPARAVFLVQREVADRMIASPGTKEYGALTVNLRAFTQVEFLFSVPRGAFQPPPAVESAVVRLTPLSEPLIPPQLENRYRSFVQSAFALRRKQMRRVLRTLAGIDAARAGTLLEQAKIDPEQRPETLTPGDFATLLTLLKESGL